MVKTLTQVEVWLERHVLPHEPALRAWLGGCYLKGLEIDDMAQETYARLEGIAKSLPLTTDQTRF
jgi:RNA polymerase sigma-70 factor (ECF subfamily)